MTRDEEEARALFVDRYRVPRDSVNRVVERAVIGSDWGANGYTTREQADLLAHLVELRADDLLLDLGAGRGWPGLYLAKQTGCRVVLADLPLQGLVEAMRRAAVERLCDRVSAVVASASHVPLRSGEVDAIISSDVLC